MFCSGVVTLGALRVLIAVFLDTRKIDVGDVGSVRTFLCVVGVEGIFLFIMLCQWSRSMAIKLGDCAATSVSKFAVGGVGGCL